MFSQLSPLGVLELAAMLAIVLFVLGFAWFKSLGAWKAESSAILAVARVSKRGSEPKRVHLLLADLMMKGTAAKLQRELESASEAQADETLCLVTNLYYLAVEDLKLLQQGSGTSAMLAAAEASETLEAFNASILHVACTAAGMKRACGPAWAALGQNAAKARMACLAALGPSCALAWPLAGRILERFLPKHIGGRVLLVDVFEDEGVNRSFAYFALLHAHSEELIKEFLEVVDASCGIGHWLHAKNERKAIGKLDKLLAILQKLNSINRSYLENVSESHWPMIQSFLSGHKDINITGVASEWQQILDFLFAMSTTESEVLKDPNDSQSAEIRRQGQAFAETMSTRQRELFSTLKPLKHLFPRLSAHYSRENRTELAKRVERLKDTRLCWFASHRSHVMRFIRASESACPAAGGCPMGYTSSGTVASAGACPMKRQAAGTATDPIQDGAVGRPMKRQAAGAPKHPIQAFLDSRLEERRAHFEMAKLTWETSS